MRGPEGPLAAAEAATARPFLLTATRVAVHGTPLRGVEGAWTDAGPLLGALRSGAGTAAAVVEGPRSLRRELATPGGSVLETVLVPERLAGLAVQWVRPREASAPLRLALSWELPEGARAEAAPPTGGPAPGGLLLRIGGRAPALHLLRPAPATWSVDEGGVVRADVEAAPGAAVTLLAAYAPDGGRGLDPLPALARLAAHEAAADAAERAATGEGLRLETGVEALDRGLARLRLRLDSPPPDAGRLWWGLGVLAAGDPDLLRGVPAGPAAADLFLAARRVARTGRGDGLARQRARIDAALASLREDPPDPPPDGEEGPAPGALAAAAYRAAVEAAAADLLDALGDRPAAEAVRARPAPSAGTGRTGPTGGPGTRLPVAGARGADARWAARLAAVLLDRGDGQAGPPARPLAPGPAGPASPLAGALDAWAAWTTHDPDGGYRLLRPLLEAAARPPFLPDPAAAGALACAVVHGLLGARPDGAFGRLRLAPDLPSGWARFAVRGLACGDAEVSMAYQRSEGTHTFVLDQTAGRVPLDLVFEPRVTGRVDLVRVDGAEAEVDIGPVGPRTRVRLQLPLDSIREIALVGEA